MVKSLAGGDTSDIIKPTVDSLKKFRFTEERITEDVSMEREDLMKMKGKKLALAVAAGMSLSMLAAPSVQAAERATLDVKEVKIVGNDHWSESMIRRMVPELQKKSVDVQKLSSELELLNDTQAGTLAADFTKAKDGGYILTVSVKEKQAQHVALNVNNSGNDYSGNWRLTTTYTNANLTQRADSLGVAYVTSPAAGHWSDVKQAALAYRTIIPQFGDSVYFTASYSDVDLGQIANFGGIGISATGKGHTLGAHYQHNLKYTRAHKQLIDLGLDYKHYNNAQDYDYAGARLLHDGVDFNVKTASASYVDIYQRPNNFFAWSLGYTGNINGDEKAFNEYRYGSDKQFNLVKASFHEQYRTPGDWVFGLRMSGQYTKDNVVTTEQLGAGGMTSVRGFQERVASADKGYVGSFEIYTPEFLKHSRFVLFTDFARLVNNHHYNGELESDSIASAGLGYRYYDSAAGWSLALSYAHAYDDLDLDRTDVLRPWQVSLTKEF